LPANLTLFSKTVLAQTHPSEDGCRQHELQNNVVRKSGINFHSDYERLLQIFFPHPVLSIEEFSLLAGFVL
jgi:hypothetical protein